MGSFWSSSMKLKLMHGDSDLLLLNGRWAERVWPSSMSLKLSEESDVPPCVKG